MLHQFDKYITSTDTWLIHEKKWKPDNQQVRESQFTLGNGYICSRGVLEEIPKGSCPGTFFAGVFDKTGAQVTELVNAPNPITFKIVTGGEKLDVTTMDVLEHERVLDMKHGLLKRKTVYKNTKGKRFDYQSLRFFSMHNKHIAAIQVLLTPLDADATFSIESSVDPAVTNMGILTEGDKKHIHIVDFSKVGDINYLCTKTFEKEVLLAYASRLKVRKNGRSSFIKRRAFNITLKKGETLRLTKYYTFYTSVHTKPERLKTKVVKALKSIEKKGFKGLMADHRNEWLKRWKMSDLNIEGDDNVQRAVRFNLYHLLIAGNDKNGDVSIGAKTLSGEGYRGHVFWDTEIFVLPFFIYTNPKIAKNLIMYRYNRLKAAKENAKQNGYDGVMFPWESADTGYEATPSWYKDHDGSIKKVNTGFQEHHITADIAYGIYNYFYATADMKFMLDYGCEMLLEINKFWASRIVLKSKKKGYEIRDVIGPDEFHEDISNNAFTNIIVKCILKQTNRLCTLLLKDYPAHVKKIMEETGVSKKDIKVWNNISENMYVSVTKDGLIEEFDGFFKLKKMRLPKLDKNYMLYSTEGITSEKMAKTQFVKQADVIMALFLFSSKYSLKILKKNFDFYEERTLHHSSLSAGIHAGMGAFVNDKVKAYKYLLTAIYTDLKDIYKNTAHGIHAASLGGVWQAIVHGFVGMDTTEGILSFSPNLPDKWNKLSFCVKWKGAIISIRIRKDVMKFKLITTRKNAMIDIKVNGINHTIFANKVSIFSLMS